VAHGIQQELDKEIRDLELHLAFWREQSTSLDRPRLLRTAANLANQIESEIATRKNAKAIFDQ